MERLTNDRTAEALRANIEKLRAAGFAIDPSDERYVRLAEFEQCNYPMRITSYWDGEYFNDTIGMYVAECANCGVEEESPTNITGYRRYCSYCGAKMDGGEPGMNMNPEKDCKESQEWCADCEHIEMCRWYPTLGCEFKSGLHPELRKKWSNQGLYPDGFGDVKVGYTCPYCHKYVPYAGRYCSKCGERVLGGDE